MNKNTKIKIRNRSTGSLSYKIPDMNNFTRTFAAGEIKELPFEEVQKLAYIPGGDYMLQHFLVIDNIEARNEILGEVELEYDLYIGGVCQEEVGLRGSLCAANYIKPDFAIILDVSAAYDTDGNTSEFGKLGHGVLLRVIDANMIARKEVIKFQKECLNNANVPYQYFISPGGTDAGSVHKSLEGIPTMTYCLVARNIHTCSSVLDVNDYISSIDGLVEVLKSLSTDLIKRFRYEI